MQTKAVALLLAFVLYQPYQAHSNELETWYTCWGLGWSDVSYPPELEDAKNELAGLPGVSHLTIAIDAFGFYWPRGKSTLFGGIVNGNVDSYEVDELSGEFKLQMFNDLYALSAIHFLNHEIGRGMFVRGDLGLVRLLVDLDANLLGSRIEESETSDWGTGIGIGAGYGIPVTNGTRVLINAYYSLRRVEGDGYQTIGLTMGGLF